MADGEGAVSQYDYHLSKIITAIIAEHNGETSLICNSDIDEAKVIASKLCKPRKALDIRAVEALAYMTLRAERSKL